MNDSRFELKVGLFVFIGVALTALLILNFSKGITIFNPTYTLRVVLPNAAGLKPAADVMMAGLPIGKVSSMDLADDERSVNLTLRILNKHKIRKDARIRIDALGFLGDQYVSVSVPIETGPVPTNADAYLQDGETVRGEPTFNMEEAVHSISTLVDQTRRTIKDLDQGITNVNASALSTNTLAHFVLAVSNLEVVSDRAVAAAGRVQGLLNDNSAAFSSSISNFQALSVRLTNTAADLDEIIVTNRADVRKVVGNLTEASDQFKKIALDLQAGKGTAGALLKDQKMAAEMTSFISNANAMTAEFSEFGHNLNRHGIWAMLWKPKHPETNSSPGRGVKGP
ncbi:MAG: MlaD family protein [Verrucomicrobiota bacterium]|jgi:phospholipid/cholesterol/gamma-HCH transport system substrate-binding protein